MNKRVLVVLWLTSCVLPCLAAASKACEPCHAAIYGTYQGTGMAQSSGQAGAGTFKESFEHGEFKSPKGAVDYRVGKETSGISFEFRQGDIQGRRQLDYFVGSGAVGRSYITAIGGFLFQAPVSYYSSTRSWGLSPGYERAEEVNLMREVEPGCLNCHATGVQPIEGTSNRYGERPFSEPGVGCERCHGAGDEHIARMKSGKRFNSSGIVNPAKLELERRDSVCAQCHLPGAVVIAKADKRSPYRPGDRLDDSVVVYIWEGATREVTVNGHFEQLARSACWRASAGKLWCGTCHDPHSVVLEEDKPAFYRSRCNTCHASRSCSAPLEFRTKAQDNCIGCHMVRTPATTVQHAAYTDHSIGRFPQPSTPLKIPSDAVLVPFPGFHSTDRELGLAYATVAINDNNRDWGMRAFELLRKASIDSPHDLKLSSQLAQLYDRMGREDRACELYAQIVASDPRQNAAAVNLGTCLAKQGKIEESIRLWKSAFERAPTLESAWLNLAVAQHRSGDVEAAKATLKKGLRFNPVSRPARQLLREMEAR